MDTGQIIVKVLLITVLAVTAVLVVLPARGSRGLAIQRLAVALLLLLGMVSVAVPELTTTVANFLGIGRGVDLLLYGFIVVVLGYGISTTSRLRRMERDVTVLARKIALFEVNAREGHDTLDDGSVRVEAHAADAKRSPVGE